jgi:hypothetical protein
MNGVREVPAQVEQHPSRIPAAFKLPLLVIFTLVLSSGLYTLAADYTGPELASVSRNLTETWHIALMFGWKLSELSIAWYLRYDCQYRG